MHFNLKFLYHKLKFRCVMTEFENEDCYLLINIVVIIVIITHQAWINIYQRSKIRTFLKTFCGFLEREFVSSKSKNIDVAIFKCKSQTQSCCVKIKSNKM